MKINRLDIVIILLIGAVVYQQVRLYQLKNELHKELQSQVDKLNLQLNDLAEKNLVIIDKLKKAKKKDSIIDKKIDDKVKVINWKLRKYEKITHSIVDQLKRDSIRSILKTRHYMPNLE